MSHHFHVCMRACVRACTREGVCTLMDLRASECWNAVPLLKARICVDTLSPFSSRKAALKLQENLHTKSHLFHKILPSLAESLRDRDVTVKLTTVTTVHSLICGNRGTPNNFPAYPPFFNHTGTQTAYPFLSDMDGMQDFGSAYPFSEHAHSENLILRGLADLLSWHTAQNRRIRVMETAANGWREDPFLSAKAQGVNVSSEGVSSPYETGLLPAEGGIPPRYINTILECVRILSTRCLPKEVSSLLGPVWKAIYLNGDRITRTLVQEIEAGPFGEYILAEKVLVGDGGEEGSWIEKMRTLREMERRFGRRGGAVSRSEVWLFPEYWLPCLSHVQTLSPTRTHAYSQATHAPAHTCVRLCVSICARAHTFYIL